MPTHFQGTPAQIQALNAYINLTRSCETLDAQLNLALAEEGLTVSQFGVLEALLHLGPLCQKSLASKLLKSSGNITLVIDNLEKQDLVKRKRDSKDRRFITISLTPKGEALIQEIFPQHVDRITAQMGRLDSEEQDTLRTLCRKLGRQDTAQS
ncbi:MarR family transcriptional regulator [bacterium (Candidatus Blackallbacteria) CG17_big_fil_post_rev_8_21_14_2_50_48_46]|uniref:MarR family transcriptional regulator n=1 Tax=bacterium (Candidatus Blackallbacteria) CG17_big_fil_post_rev_8_21_14_2_50_48_46 TaxID=2014261 RepID=A0A2M7G0R3_9BACT|nr:MAG: MarR family transcriptional regulator [bacterium (Candidatus Blackallbacteria) CG18_big_fil_WC_8_21_14_2_50_49_26]PIW14840.1 MAG: MarR family transcriptional regulator [bacterium (Candidatus Blackallbacteria) CG17_big_fil_post_rev_8_21_14_2_50_48_46]PIW44407.1 MAG: MarR family transcriptional regulator [bacterium (Candidatus Blackallbacteria) CG13_big_fil_rev_8_21_14_2_50_49_14]